MTHEVPEVSGADGPAVPLATSETTVSSTLVLVEVLQTGLLMDVFEVSMAVGHAGAGAIVSSIVGGETSFVVVSVSSFSN